MSLTSPAVRAIALLAAGGLVTASLSLDTLSRVKDAVVFRSLRGQPIGAAVLLGTLRWEDAVLAALAVAVVALMLRLQWRTRAYTRLARDPTPTQALLVLLIVVAWLGHSYLARGVLLGGDTGTHVARFLEVSRGLAQGRLAQWTNYQYAGAPLLWFTGPLTYVAGGLLTAATGSALLSAKALLFGLHVGSGLAFFAFCLRLGFRPAAATLASACFAGAFAHLHLFLYRGVIPQAFTIVLLVLLFHGADGLLRGRGGRAWNFVVFAGAVAGLIVNHQPHALFAAVYLGVFAIPMFARGAWQWRGVPVLAIAGLAGLITSAVAVLPALAEAGWVMIEPDSALFRLQWPTQERILHLLRWANTRTTWGIDYWAYLGLGTIGFGAAGLFAAATRRLSGTMEAAALSACLCLPVCLVLYNPVVRDIIFLLFFACVLVAAGVEWLLGSGVVSGRVFLLASVVTLADLASTSVQPLARNDKAFLVDAGKLLERSAPGQRVLEINVAADGTLSADIGPDANPGSYFATVQRIAGNHNMAATRLHNFLVSTAKRAEADLRRTGGLSPEVTALLGVFNVGRVVCHSPVANGCPVGSNASEGVLGGFIAIPASPVLFSTRLVPLPRAPVLDKPMLWVEDFEDPAAQPRIAAIDGFLDRFVEAERPEPDRMVAAAIPIAGDCDTCGAGDGAPAPPALRDYRVGLDRVALAVDLAQPGYLQLAHPWFPSTEVTVNGQQVRPIRGALDLLVLPLGAGPSVITLQDRLTPARRVGLWISAGGVLLTALGAIGLSFRARSP